jgi:hypothetical protein
MSRLESCLLQPLPAQSNPWFYFPVGKIANRFDFQAALSGWFLKISQAI